MQLSTVEKIKVLLGRRNLNIGDLAKLMGTSRQNLCNKFGRDNLTDKDLQAIASALDCTYDVTFTMNDTGESI